MVTEDKCETCDGTGAVAVEVDGVKGIDSCPLCNGTGKRARPANDAKVLHLAPLVPEADIVSAIAARIIREYEDAHEWETMRAEDVTICGRLCGARAAL